MGGGMGGSDMTGGSNMGGGIRGGGSEGGAFEGGGSEGGGSESGAFEGGGSEGGGSYMGQSDINVSGEFGVGGSGAGFSGPSQRNQTGVPVAYSEVVALRF